MIGWKETLILWLVGGASSAIPLALAYFYIFPKGQR